MKSLKVRFIHFIILVVILLFSCHGVFAQDFWYPLYGPYGGNILSFDRNSLGTLFVGTEGGGLFRSFDDGDTWELSINGIPIDEGITTGFKIYSIHTIGTDDIFIGTSKEARIFRSTDGGNNWTQVYSNTNLTENTLCITADNNGVVIFAGTETTGILKSTDNGNSWTNPLTSQTVKQILAADNGDFVAATSTGIFKSTDSGDTWFLSNNGLTNFNIVSLNKNTLGGIYCSTINNKVFKSTNNAISWIELASGPASTVYCLSSNSSNVLYAGTSSGLSKSTNDGNTWTEDSLDNKLIRTIHFTNFDKMYVGTNWFGMYKYPQGGTHYENINNGLKNTFINAMTFNLNGDLFCAVSGNKFYRTNNLGITWIDLSDEVSVGMSPSKIISLLTLPNGVMIAGTMLQGVFRSVDGGANWTQILNGFTTYTINTLALDKAGNILAGSSGKLYKSNNQGLDWVAIDNNQVQQNIYDIAVNSSGHIFLATYGGVYRSTDNGSNWTQVNNGFLYNYAYAIGIRENDAIYVTGEMNGIYRSSNNGDSWTSVYTATMSAHDMVINELGDVFVSSINSKGVLRSIDDGATWEEINSGLYNFNIRCLALSPNSSLLSGGEGTGVWLSLLPTGANHFGGNTNLGLPIQYGIPVMDIVVIHSNPVSSPKLNSDYPIENVMVTLQELNHPDISELLVTLTHDGVTDTLVYQPGINGADFFGTKFKDDALLELSQGTAPFTGSFKPRSALSVFNGLEATGDWEIGIIDQAQGNDGVFESWSISILSDPSTGVNDVENIPTDFIVYQNYPNPFNPSTKIKFRISDFGFVNLKVYDVLGSEVATLVNEEKLAGSYEVSFDASHLSSGIYFYKLQSGSLVKTKKMILLK